MDFFKSKKLIFIVFLLILTPLIASLIITNFDKLLKNFQPPQPQGEVKIELPKVEAKSAELQKGPYTCPSVTDFCTKSQDIFKVDKYIGFGSKIATNSALVASFDGTISAVSSTLGEEFNSETIITLYLDDKNRGLRAVYYYNGDVAPESKEVKAGDEIATTGDIMKYYNTSLVFALIKNDFISGTPEKLTSKDFVVP